MLMDDFNINLLKYDTNAANTAFLDIVYTSPPPPLYHNRYTGYNTLKNTQ